jgi:hypothetical protein
MCTSSTVAHATWPAKAHRITTSIRTPVEYIGDDVNAGADALDDLAAVTLTGASTIDTTGGDLYIEDTLDGDGNPGDFDLTLDTGHPTLPASDGSIFVGAFDDGAGTAVTGRVGGTDRIGNILIRDALNVTFGSNDVAGPNATANDPTNIAGTYLDPSTQGTGTIDAVSFTQALGSGSTNLNGRSIIAGVNDGTGTAFEISLRTGAYDDQAGGNVSITLDGPDAVIGNGDEGVFRAVGAIVSRGGDTTADGAGNDAGFVDIQAGDIEVALIDASGSDALNSGLGGLGATISLDATGSLAVNDDVATQYGGAGVTPDTLAEIILHGDLLANGGTDAATGLDTGAAAVSVGDNAAPFDDVIIIAPSDTDAGNQNVVDIDAGTTTGTLLVTGQNVDFYGPVNADTTRHRRRRRRRRQPDRQHVRQPR